MRGNEGASTRNDGEDTFANVIYEIDASEARDVRRDGYRSSSRIDARNPHSRAPPHPLPAIFPRRVRLRLSHPYTLTLITKP